MKKINILRLLTAILSVATAGFLAFLYFVKKTDITVAAVVAGIFIMFQIIVLVMYSTIAKERFGAVENSINNVTKYIVEEAKMGILTYNADFEIEWMSSMFTRRHLEHTGEKILAWLPELEHLLKSGQTSETIVINEEKYRVYKKEDINTLLFKDITEEYDLRKKNEGDAYVMGLVSYDNYDEANETEEDAQFMNTNIRVSVGEYFRKYNIDYKTLRNNRILLILNERQYNLLLEDRFSILNTVRKDSINNNMLITLSMAFARGSENIAELDALVYKLLDLAQTRGGDQVVSRIVGQEAVFYGGSSEARENQSKVKARVMSNTIKDQILKASNVIITGHYDADADAIGSAICMSSIVGRLNKEAIIIYEKNAVEGMIADVVSRYRNELDEHHTFMSNAEAIEHMDNDTLVLMVDHHSLAQSMGKEVLAHAKKIIIIDHHRRMADLDVNPLFVYLEAGASSTCELTAEFIPYLTKRSLITPLEATIMYLGLIIDTNHFRNRTDARTFEVAKALKGYGADIRQCELLSREPFELIKKRAEIIGEAYNFAPNILIAAGHKDIYPRSIASQASDSLLETKTVDAVFVIVNTSKEEAIITARSNGNVNVQVILEKMNGGGHMTAAGLQTKEKSVAQLEEELKEVLKGTL